ncbi:hypothetical protein FQR65_LT13638 [Abscondita terminalis]|nr:hypothetical protein FQR65_LT13638 [Abscondita terminalis]
MEHTRTLKWGSEPRKQHRNAHAPLTSHTKVFREKYVKIDEISHLINIDSADILIVADCEGSLRDRMEHLVQLQLQETRETLVLINTNAPHQPSSQNAARERQRRATETEQQSFERRKAAALRERQRRLMETEEQRRKRRAAAALRERRRRMLETEEQKRRRRESAALRERMRRMFETPEQARKRRQTAALRQRMKRLQKTTPQPTMT